MNQRNKPLLFWLFHCSYALKHKNNPVGRRHNAGFHVYSVNANAFSCPVCVAGSVSVCVGQPWSDIHRPATGMMGGRVICSNITIRNICQITWGKCFQRGFAGSILTWKTWKTKKKIMELPFKWDFFLVHPFSFSPKIYSCLWTTEQRRPNFTEMQHAVS